MPADYATLLGEDEMAEVLGQLCMSFASARIRRHLYMLIGWPHRMVGVLNKDDSKVQQTVQEFMVDHKNFMELQQRANSTDEEDAVLRRHVMNLVVNQQYAIALQECNWVATPEFKAVVSQHFSGITTTQLIEDMIGVQKNSREFKQSNRFRKVQTIMAKFLTSNLIDTRHHYTKVEPLTNFLAGTQLPGDAWRGEQEDWSLPFQEVVSTAAAPPWYSPGATNTCVRDADLAMLRSSAPSASVQAAWLASCFDIKYKFVVKAKLNQELEPKVMLACYCFPDSAALVWPLQERSVPGHLAARCVEPEVIDKPHCLSILSLLDDSIMACSFKWLSWATQWQRFPEARGLWKPAVRMFLDSGGFMPLRKLMAAEAFWTFPRSLITKYCSYFNVELDQGASLFEVVRVGVQGILECTDEEAFAIASKRLSNMAHEAQFCDEMCKVDAYIETFDKHDHEPVLQVHKDHLTKQEAQQEYINDVAKYKSTIVQDAKKKSLKKTKYKAYPKLPCSIPHLEAKQFVPPGASIWRGLQQGPWAGHMPPFPRCSARWSQYGEEESMRVILRKLWEQHLQLIGEGVSSCPIQGLFQA